MTRTDRIKFTYFQEVYLVLTFLTVTWLTHAVVHLEKVETFLWPATVVLTGKDLLILIMPNSHIVTHLQGLSETF